MIRHSRIAALLPSMTLVLFTGGAAFGGFAAADEQKLQPGDARHDFMKNCLKSAHASAPAAS
jgi:hypothetical protein